MTSFDDHVHEFQYNQRTAKLWHMDSLVDNLGDSNILPTSSRLLL